MRILWYGLAGLAAFEACELPVHQSATNVTCCRLELVKMCRHRQQVEVMSSDSSFHSRTGGMRKIGLQPGWHPPSAQS